MRVAAIGVLFAAGTMVFMTSGVLPAAAQTVAGSRTPARVEQPAERGGNIEARKEFESSGAASRRVPCDQVISRVDRYADLRRGNEADMSVVAKELGTSATWVERCMRAYGRRPKRPSVESAETTEQRLESFEEDEPEEVGPEDIEEERALTRRRPPERQPRWRRATPKPQQGDQEGSE